jgi:hypothetical protein
MKNAHDTNSLYDGLWNTCQVALIKISKFKNSAAVKIQLWISNLSASYNTFGRPELNS